MSLLEQLKKEHQGHRLLISRFENDSEYQHLSTIDLIKYYISQVSYQLNIYFEELTREAINQIPINLKLFQLITQINI